MFNNVIITLITTLVASPFIAIIILSLISLFGGAMLVVLEFWRVINRNYLKFVKKNERSILRYS